MPDSCIRVDILQRAVTAYLAVAYPAGNVPAAVRERVDCWAGLAGEAYVPESCFEVSTTEGRKVYALRLGQPIYPHMKLIVEECPAAAACADARGLLFRADAHDAHLHAPAGSPDAAPLAAMRAVNKQLTEAIEAAWVAAGLPTFREFLRQQGARRRAAAGPEPA
jgi:hypothetical protein